MYRLKINRSLAQVRINYFCQFFVIAGFFVYLNPILASCGLSAYQIGITSFLANIAATISRLIFGPLADGTKKRHLVLAGLSVSTAIFISQFAFLPTSWEAVYYGFTDKSGRFTSRVEKIYKNGAENHTHAGQSILPCWPSILDQCKLVLGKGDIHLLKGQSILGGHSEDGLVATYMLPHDVKPLLDNQEERLKLVCRHEGPSSSYPCTTIRNHSRGTALFWVVIFGIILRTLTCTAHAPLPNLLDSMAYNLLGEENAHMYGRSRAFGSAGYVTGSLVSGSLISITSKQRTEAVWIGFDSSANTAPTSNFIATIILGTGAALLGALVSSVPSTNIKVVRTKLPEAIMLGLRSPAMIKCVINSLLSGLIYSFFFEYFFFVLTEKFAVPPYVMGLLTSVIVIGEIPAFTISGIIMNRAGETVCLCIAHLLFAMRFFSFAYFENYWVYLASDALFGASFPFLYNSLISQAGKAGRGVQSSHGNVVNSMHALMNAILFGLTACIGGAVWGVLLEYFTGRQLFYAASASSLVLFLLTPLISTAVDRCFQYATRNDTSIVVKEFLSD